MTLRHMPLGSIPCAAKKPACRYFTMCGGCDFLDATYEEQLQQKEEYLNDLFKQFSVKEFAPIVPSPHTVYYRNKMEYAVGGTSELPVIGLRQKKRFRTIIDLHECAIFLEDTGRILDIVRKWIRDSRLQPYDLLRHTGTIRYVTMRHSKYYNELMIIIVAAMTREQYEAGRTQFLDLTRRLKDIEAVKSIYLCLNDSVADVAITDEIILLYGEGHIKENINGIDYLIRPATFFQTNSACCHALYDVIKNEARNIRGSALDIYCGSGGITLQVAEHFERVIGIDISPRNIGDALENARSNGIKNVEFVCEDAKAFLSKLSVSGIVGDFSALIIDPPRSGLTKKEKAIILESKAPILIYVSCNPKNLAEDITSLNTLYRVEKIIPVDMFPHTRHVEVVAILKILNRSLIV